MFAKAASVPVEKLCRLGLFAVAARTLKEAAFGRFQFADTATALLLLASDLGLGLWTTRALARSGAARAADAANANANANADFGTAAQAIVATGLWVRCLAAIPYAGLVLGAAFAVGPGETRAALAVLGVAALAGAFVEYCGAIFRGYERLRDEARLNVLRAVLVSAAGLLALAWRPSVVALAAGMATGATAAAVSGLVVVRRRYRLPTPLEPGTFDRRLARAAVREALPLWLATLMSLVYFKGDAILLRMFVGDAAVGSYSAAYKIFEATMIVPSIVLAAFFPALVRVDAEREPGRRARVELGLGAALLGLGLLAGATVLLASDLAIRLAFGEAFANAVPTLRVLALGVPLVFLNYGLTHFLIARHLERANLVFTFVMMVLNLGANLLFIPRFAGRGAAFTTVGTELALTGCCLVILIWGGRSSESRSSSSSSSPEGPAEARRVRTSE
jgi:O-antigen/teichoic acid export membrane protein